MTRPGARGRHAVHGARHDRHGVHRVVRADLLPGGLHQARRAPRLRARCSLPYPASILIQEPPVRGSAPGRLLRRLACSAGRGARRRIAPTAAAPGDGPGPAAAVRRPCTWLAHGQSSRPAAARARRARAPNPNTLRAARSGGFYARNDGKNWIGTMLATATLFPMACFGIAAALNTVAIAYHSLAAVPFGSIMVVLLIWMFISFPLCLLGTVRARAARPTRPITADGDLGAGRCACEGAGRARGSRGRRLSPCLRPRCRAQDVAHTKGVTCDERLIVSRRRAPGPSPSVPGTALPGSRELRPERASRRRALDRAQVVGRNYNGVPDNPCRVKRIPSPIPAKQWYLRPPVIALTGGLLPFGSIFIEMYFIFTSFWNYKARPRPPPSLPPSGSKFKQKFIHMRASGASVATGRPSRAPVGRRGRPSRNAWQGRKHCTPAFWTQLLLPTPFQKAQLCSTAPYGPGRCYSLSAAGRRSGRGAAAEHGQRWPALHGPVGQSWACCRASAQATATRTRSCVVLAALARVPGGPAAPAGRATWRATKWCC